MLFIKLSSSISINTLVQFWPIPIIWIIVTSLSLGLSDIFARSLGYSGYLQNFIKVTVGFCNTNSVPAGIIHVLALGGNSNWLKWGDYDTPGAMDVRGISYIVLYSAFVNLGRWSYGTKLFKSSSKDDEETLPLLTPSNTDSKHTNSILTKFYKKFNHFLTPPLIGTYAAVIIIVVPHLKSFLFSKFFLFKSLRNGLSYIGECTVPLLLLNLGCEVYFASNRSTQERIHVPVTLILFLRHLLIPAITLILLYLIKPYYELGNDPMFQLAMMLVASGAPSSSLVQLSAYTNSFKDEVAFLLLYSYILAIPCLTALVGIFMFIIPKWYE